MTNLKKVIDRVASKYVAQLKRVVPKDSGKLQSSISYKLSEDGFEVDAAEYMDMLDKGIQGVKNRFNSIYAYTTKKPPIKKIQGWADRKGINVWALQNSLYNNGIKPKRFLSKADGEIDFDEITEAYSKDVDELFNF